MTPPRERAAPLAPEDRRKAILDVVVPLVRQHGAGVTTRQVAEAAGIAEGTIFRVFEDKRALLMAAAEEIVNPVGARDRLADALAGRTTLEAKIVAAVHHLVANQQDVMALMMVLRPMLGPPVGTKPGPPAFVQEANARVLAHLTEMVFGPHADTLRLPPDRAALILRSIVFGAWHPGMHQVQPLTADEIASVVLHGIVADDPEES